jgi:hypothetical protein
MSLDLEGKLVRLENGAWARYRAVPMAGQNGLHVVVAIELSPEEREQLEKNGGRTRTLH